MSLQKNILKNKTTLVTGGAGFIGSHLCERLLELGSTVICVDNLSSGNMNNLNACIGNSNFTFVEADCNKREKIKKIFLQFNIDYVFHYAATVGVKRTQEHPLHVLKDIEGIKNLLDLSRLNKVQKFVFSSSSEIYGEQINGDLHEDDDPKVKMPYAVVKIVGETYCKTYWKEYGLNTTSLRFFNVYGPRQDCSSYGFVVPIFMNQALAGKDLTVFNDGQMTRSFIFIKDNVEASIIAALTPKASGECVNIGTSNYIKIIDLAKEIIKASGKDNIKPILLHNKRPGEIKYRRPSLRKMHRLLKFRAKYSFKKGLRETLLYFQNNNN